MLRGSDHHWYSTLSDTVLDEPLCWGLGNMSLQCQGIGVIVCRKGSVINMRIHYISGHNSVGWGRSGSVLPKIAASSGSNTLDGQITR